MPSLAIKAPAVSDEMRRKINKNPALIRHLATQHRAELGEGYEQDSRFMGILNKLTDVELVEQYFTYPHHRLRKSKV